MPAKKPLLEGLGVRYMERLARAERRLLVEAFEACGRRPDVASVERLRRAFTSGDVITAEALDAVR